MRIIFSIISIFVSSLLFSQVYERYRVEEVEITYPRKFEVMWTNDVFFQTDRYYTNGLQIEYYTQSLERFGITKLLLDPMSESGPIYSFSLTHDIFTPRNVLGDPDLKDRPYAGILLFGIKAVHFSPEKNYRFTSEIQAGLLGKYAGGQFVQNSIHVILPASEPIPGWAFQIHHDLCLQYNTGIEKMVFSSRWFDTDVLARGRLGLPYTDFAGGGRIRVGKMAGYYTTDHLLSKNHNQVYFFAEALIRTIFFDATLQGGAFNDHSPHTIVNINPLLTDIKTGVVFRYANLAAETGAQLVSSKFEGALPHKWVYFKFGVLF